MPKTTITVEMYNSLGYCMIQENANSVKHAYRIIHKYAKGKIAKTEREISGNKPHFKQTRIYCFRYTDKNPVATIFIDTIDYSKFTQLSHFV